MALLEAELGPGLALGDAWIHRFFDDCSSDAPGCLYFLAIVVEAVGDDGFGTIFVG